MWDLFSLIGLTYISEFGFRGSVPSLNNCIFDWKIFAKRGAGSRYLPYHFLLLRAILVWKSVDDNKATLLYFIHNITSPNKFDMNLATRAIIAKLLVWSIPFHWLVMYLLPFRLLIGKLLCAFSIWTSSKPLISEKMPKKRLMTMKELARDRLHQTLRSARRNAASSRQLAPVAKAVVQSADVDTLRKKSRKLNCEKCTHPKIRKGFVHFESKYWPFYNLFTFTTHLII